MIHNSKVNILNDAKNSNILLITQYVPHYRIAIYNILNKRLNFEALNINPEFRMDPEYRDKFNLKPEDEIVIV